MQVEIEKALNMLCKTRQAIDNIVKNCYRGHLPNKQTEKN